MTVYRFIAIHLGARIPMLCDPGPPSVVSMCDPRPQNAPAMLAWDELQERADLLNMLLANDLDDDLIRDGAMRPGAFGAICEGLIEYVPLRRKANAPSSDAR